MLQRTPVADVKQQQLQQRKLSNYTQLAKDVDEFSNQIIYSSRYSDAEHEYRHVILPKQLAEYVPSDRLMAEHEWRSIGVTQSPGWYHYMIHAPEPHILLFKRPKI